ncbi:MAG: SRPBCC family protein [Rhodospirillales bacterium]|nr:SRPBCC family protein [Rhodospirillales bacterium]
MKIENTLTLSLPPEDAWKLLLDIPYVAPCLPGTELTEIIDERTFEGTVKLKLGPVSLSFQGTAKIEDVDPETRTVRVSAKGREDRGRGTANADVAFTLSPDDTGTRVDVVTDLQLAGSIIQYARGASVIERTAQSLVDQFTTRLTAKIESGEEPDAEAIKVGSLLWHGIKSSIGGKSKDNGEGS